MSHHRRNAELTQLRGKQQTLICQLKTETKKTTTIKHILHQTSVCHLRVVGRGANKVSAEIKYTFESGLVGCLLNISR